MRPDVVAAATGRKRHTGLAEPAHRRGQRAVKKCPLVAELQTAGSVPELEDAELEPGTTPGTTPSATPSTTPNTSARLPLSLRASLGRAKLSFDGSSASASSLGTLAGQYDLSGSSLAAVGDTVGVSLPTAGAFRSRGRIVKDGVTQNEVWRVVVDDAVVGSSRLNGAFTYEAVSGVHKLSVRSGGSRLLLSDLGPAIGGVPRDADGSAPAKAKTARPSRVLPARPVDLKALRVHSQLVGGVLTLSHLEARTAQGELPGLVRLDGRNATALWNARLRWNDVCLEHWIKQVRANAAPPWVSGRLNGNAVVQGQGRSTDKILATLKGNVRTKLKGGAVSHLAIEAAGRDLAQGTGMLVKGDAALPVQCGVADLAVDAGRFKPRLMVIDTKDSAV
jgi:AsmA family protein